MNSDSLVITQKKQTNKNIFVKVSNFSCKIEFFVSYNGHQNCLDKSLAFPREKGRGSCCVHEKMLSCEFYENFLNNFSLGTASVHGPVNGIFQNIFSFKFPFIN